MSIVDRIMGESFYGKKPSTEFELSDPVTLYTYAKDFVKGRYPEAERVLVNDPQWACFYARDIIKGRWPEAEAAIVKSPWAAFYAQHVIKGRWPEAEAAIAKDPDDYAEYVRFLRSTT